ncbi:MAG: hypothetical protein WCS85_01125 [Candidatus Peribacteraceae bacterium]
MNKLKVGDAMLDFSQGSITVNEKEFPHVTVSQDGQGNADIGLSSAEVEIRVNQDTGRATIAVSGRKSGQVGSTAAFRANYDTIFRRGAN